MQYGVKFNKFSALLVAFEDSNIEINQLATNDFNTKKYNNFFQAPSSLTKYQIRVVHL
jgi:hypothetical protein